MMIYLKNKIKMLLGRNFYFVWLIIEMFIINEKKLEKLVMGFGILKNCMIYRRLDMYKIWIIVIWNGFVIIRLL